VSKVIRQKAASPCRHPLRLQMDSSNVDLHLVAYVHVSEDPQATTVSSQMTCRSV